MKKATLIILILLLCSILICIGYVWFSRDNTSTTQTDDIWVTYTNETYGYRIDATMADGRILEENLDVIESDTASGENPGAESRIFYFKEIGIGNNHLGIISCYDDRQPWPELSNEMPLQDYAQKLFEIEMSIGPGPSYDQKISIADLHPSSVDEREAYTFVYGQVKDQSVDIRANTITENTDGKKCWIRHPITDHVRGYDAEMLNHRTHWFNSFTWTR